MKYWYWRGPGFYRQRGNTMQKVPSTIWGNRNAPDLPLDQQIEWVEDLPMSTKKNGQETYGFYIEQEEEEG